METIHFLLGAFALAICFNACLSQSTTSYAKTCSDCNSTNADCILKQGYVMCTCKSGFVGNGLNCTPVVFCGTTNTCCPPGYIWDNTKKACVDTNECLNSLLHTCLTQSECINMRGIYLCNAVPNPTCPAEVCSTDKDCIRDGTILKCIDPCEDYQEIDGSRRLYTLNSVGRFPTDRYLFGWYRYKNGLGLREGYVGPLKCGSVEPYSLSSHPTVSEGVKSVALLTNGLTSNTTGPSILVKACAGGYHVYKFRGLLKSEVYCSDYPLTTTSTTTATTTTTTTATTPTTTATTSVSTTATTTTATTTTPTTTTQTTTTPTTTATTSVSTTATTTTATTTTPTTTTQTTTTPTTATTTPPNTTTTTEMPTTLTATTTATTTSTPTTMTLTTTPTTTATPTSTTTTTTPITSTTPTTSTTATSLTTIIPTPNTETTTEPPTTETTTQQPSTNNTTGTTTEHPSTSTATPTPSSTASCKNQTTQSTVLPTTRSPVEENITVTTVQSKSILKVRVLTHLVNNKEVKSLEINETTTVNIEMRTISSSKIYIKTTKSITPSSILIHIGSDGAQTLTNATDSVITTTENTIPNTDNINPDTYCSRPVKTNTVTDTSVIAGNTCSKVTSATITTTITTTEEVIVLGPHGFSKSCGYD